MRSEAGGSAWGRMTPAQRGAVRREEAGGLGSCHSPLSAGCDCSPCGMEACDPHSGHCLCKAGVMGPRCDRCQVGLPRAGPQGWKKPRVKAGQSHDCSLCPQEGHFGFEGCGGCRPCACGPAAQGSECHPQSGQCHCQPGAGGLQCRECAPGHWGLPEQGCRRECGALWGRGHPGAPLRS